MYIPTKLKTFLDNYLPWLTSHLRKVRDLKMHGGGPAMTDLGFMFYGNKDMESLKFEPIETKLVNQILPQVGTVINIGANIGYYTCLALNKNKKVIAFEPIESNLKYLLRNVKANNWDDACEIFPIALSNKVGIVEIYGGGTGASLIGGWAGIAKNYSTLVPCSTANKILRNFSHGERILVIMDVEGVENLVLEGATNLLEMSPKPIWLVEIAGDTHLPKGAKVDASFMKSFDFFWDRGYQARSADHYLRVIEKDEVQEFIDSQINSLGTHNFIFCDPRSSIIQLDL